MTGHPGGICMIKRIELRGCEAGKEEAVDVVVRDDGKVESVTPAGRHAPDFGSEAHVLGPTLFDMQVNGALGVDLQDPALTEERFRFLNTVMQCVGVERWMPTLITDSIDALEEKCHRLAQWMEDPEIASHIPGIHLEGPFISPADGPRGAHPARHVQRPDIKIFDRLQRAAKRKIRMITLAPEQPGALQLIRHLSQSVMLVSLGHHAANEKAIFDAVEAGAAMCTHLGNGMSPMIHRHYNPLWLQMIHDDLAASVIADLEHLPISMLEAILRCKGEGSIVLVSDSVFLAGMKPGKYRLFDADVEMKESGRICLSGTDLLAGSSLFLPQAVAYMATFTSMSLEDAFAAASTVPAQLLGIRTRRWRPRTGANAGFALYPPLEYRARFLPIVTVTGGKIYTPSIRDITHDLRNN